MEITRSYVVFNYHGQSLKIDRMDLPWVVDMLTKAKDRYDAERLPYIVTETQNGRFNYSIVHRTRGIVAECIEPELAQSVANGLNRKEIHQP